MAEDRIAESWKTSDVEDDLRDIRDNINLRVKAHGILERQNYHRDFRFFMLMTTATFLSAVMAGVLEYYEMTSELLLFAVVSPALTVFLLAIYRHMNYSGKRLGHITTSGNIGGIATRITIVLDTKLEHRRVMATEFFKDVDDDFGRITGNGQYIPHTLLEELSKKDK